MILVDDRLLDARPPHLRISAPHGAGLSEEPDALQGRAAPVAAHLGMAQCPVVLPVKPKGDTGPGGAWLRVKNTRKRIDLPSKSWWFVGKFPANQLVDVPMALTSYRTAM